MNAGAAGSGKLPVLKYNLPSYGNLYYYYY